jgi:serine/threonine-protein kinase
VGRTVLDRYVLVKPLARGGISLVYEAIDVSRMRSAAVKVLAPTFARNTRACQAARQEPLVMQQLRHPSVPRIYAFGDVAQAGGGGLPAVAMELISGVPLAHRLARGALPWQQAVEIAAMIAEMLAVAHRRGIVHRDLTPDNVMLTPRGVKVIDFGLAAMSIQGRVSARVKSDIPVRPEACQDVYALGVLLYQMLTGRSPYPVPFPHMDRWPTASRIARPAPTPVLAGIGVPREIADLCRSCMTKRPGDRPDSATAALELWSTLIAIDPDAAERAIAGDGVPRAATVACY